jgi:hypothetical protein
MKLLLVFHGDSLIAPYVGDKRKESKFIEAVIRIHVVCMFFFIVHSVLQLY